MIFRLLVIVLILVLIIYLLRMVTGTSDYKRCQKCDGKGFWRATRGEKTKCDVCHGSGKILRR